MWSPCRRSSGSQQFGSLWDGTWIQAERAGERSKAPNQPKLLNESNEVLCRGVGGSILCGGTVSEGVPCVRSVSEHPIASSCVLLDESLALKIADEENPEGIFPRLSQPASDISSESEDEEKEIGDNIIRSTILWRLMAGLQLGQQVVIASAKSQKRAVHHHTIRVSRTHQRLFQ